MGLEEEPSERATGDRFRKTAARCWAMLSARAPPQSEIQFDQATGSADWPEMDQTVSESDDGWN